MFSNAVLAFSLRASSKYRIDQWKQARRKSWESLTGTFGAKEEEGIRCCGETNSTVAKDFDDAGWEKVLVA
ncbi:hypothetical protein VPNG_09979 [Cytospora leucostoma]|uniref:Uncharacterized protein n=1 Tax=Cytospora leucostoma TaxID=1230097 RepID=A0A423VK59_9PEZI|nr:hypothetical protein VPNG_09979 [Cytospora leucostoma]